MDREIDKIVIVWVCMRVYMYLCLYWLQITHACSLTFIARNNKSEMNTHANLELRFLCIYNFR